MFSVVYAFISAAISLYRRRFYLQMFSLSFIAFVFANFIGLYQVQLSYFLAYIVHNLMYIIGYLLIITGLYHLYGARRYQRHFWLYLIIPSILLAYFTYVDFNIQARVVVMALFAFILVTEAIIYFHKNRDQVYKDAHRVILLLCSFSNLMWLLRIVFAVMIVGKTQVSLNQVWNGVFYTVGILSMNIWFALFLWLDARTSMFVVDQRNEQLSKMAFIDQLTGLANRYYLELDKDYIVDSARKNNSPLTMMMIDLDRFKIVNDSFGHDVGDDVLRKSAEILISCARTTDRIYRWGGEEFMILLPDTEVDRAENLASRILDTFRISSFNKIQRLTVSIGLAQLQDNETVEDWFKRADLALYQAKQTGRDRFVSWINNEVLPEHFSLIEWDDNLLSGNELMDREHKKLFKRYNQIHDMIVNQTPIDTIHDQLDQLSMELNHHRDHEERLMTDIKYPEFEEHRDIHLRVQSEYEIMIKKTVKGDISLAAFMAFLVDKVIVGHIRDEDTKFYPYLNRKR